MTREEAKAIIKKEQLHRWLWYERPDRAIECMAIYSDADQWVVSATGERGSEEGICFYDDEGEALDRFISRLRATERLLRGGHMTVNVHASWGWGKYSSPDDIDRVTP